RTRDAAEQPDDQQWHERLRVVFDLLAVSPQAAELTRPQRRRAGRVSDRGKLPGGEQSGEGEEGPATGHGVDGAGDGGSGDEQEILLPGGHRSLYPRLLYRP